MNISQKGIDLIKKYEGCHLTAYVCPAGKNTIGYGHTSGVSLGMTITKEQAEAYLQQDIAKHEKNVYYYDYKYRWNQNEFDALVSFSFNIGSIKQLTKKGTRSRATISKKMLEYINGDGKVLNGLVKRRKEEQALFLAPIETKGQMSPTETHKATSTYPTLKVGSKGEYVEKLQKFLLEKNIYHGKIDGVFGPITKQAVIEWQGYCEIVKDGIVGPCTWATIG